MSVRDIQYYMYYIFKIIKLTVDVFGLGGNQQAYFISIWWNLVLL